MLRDTADSQADVNRFVEAVVANEEVWHLNSESSGAASCESSEFENKPGEPADVLLFFSDAAYARRAQSTQFPDHQPEPLTLFNFLYRWLPGMSSDALLAGPNGPKISSAWNWTPMTFERRLKPQCRLNSLSGTSASIKSSPSQNPSPPKSNRNKERQRQLATCEQIIDKQLEKHGFGASGPRLMTD